MAVNEEQSGDIVIVRLVPRMLRNKKAIEFLSYICTTYEIFQRHPVPIYLIPFRSVSYVPLVSYCNQHAAALACLGGLLNLSSYSRSFFESMGLYTILFYSLYLVRHRADASRHSELNLKRCKMVSLVLGLNHSLDPNVSYSSVIFSC